jgi:GH24 family phage-related lysozyme (muramidase)
MVHAALRKNDGLSSGRVWLRSIVKQMQSALNQAGHRMEADGKFGSGTEGAVKAFQAAHGLAQTGIVDKPCWEALQRFLDGALGPHLALIAELMPAFHGDLGWVHEQEGHRGSAYWPGGQSGVTLDPGVDVGHANVAIVERFYKPLMSAEQYRALEKTFGLKGDAASAALEAGPTLKTIRISSDQADEIMPQAAKPYWDDVAKRFPALSKEKTIGSVQTVLLSLAYNRGPNNPGLDPLRADLDAGNWSGVADSIGAMQQDHRLEGIRTRRRREADLIRAELEYLES